MARPRDSQRSRMYASEYECYGWSKMEFQSMPELEEYLWSVLENRHVLSKYKMARDIVAGTQKLKVSAGQGHRRALVRFELAHISVTFPRKTRCKWVVLHEIAHMLTPREAAAHGREFARTYLHLVKLFLGRETEKKLKTAMKKHKCKYSKTHTRWKGPIPQEEKDAMLARLREGRKTKWHTNKQSEQIISGTS